VQQHIKGVVTVLYGFVANFILFLTVEEIWRFVKFWPSYSKLNQARFLGHSAITIQL